VSFKLKLLNKFSDWMVKRGSTAMITRDDQPYLLRHFLIRTPWFSVFLHRFYAPDDGATGVHCHPWNNMSIILHGGFKELFHDGTLVDRKPGAVCFRQAKILHRIDTLLDEPGNVFTLFVVGRRQRTWGFFADPKWLEVRVRTDANKKGWFLPKGETQPRDENSLVKK
jgi:hypothetical protein